MDAQFLTTASPVSITTDLHGGVPVICVSGEIDMSNERTVGEHISDQVGQRPGAVVLDLSGITFMGSSGIRLLLDAHSSTCSAGTRMVVVADHQPVLRPLAIAQVDRVLHLRADVTAALAACA
ncbi:hypothetical protein BBK82_31155 [Lentzea guizhouensis]|uniref:Anti-sigma factor antagonist n=1 Tax=Lentzea guizhouensis TaxID=1586287 RepID=A0A1B2HQ39_9PSEU|nr:STAS domain-containing protein [Lentzea guizhouensis]ANZ39844.1 hypothetical protein BBK82_31155 [Lentzea guizhouensis]